MKINIMENNDFIEGWVATDVDGTHLFVNKPYRAKFGTHFSWVGYQIKDADSLALRAKSELNIKDNDEPIKVKININAEIAEESVVIATEHFVSNWPAKSKFDYTPIDLDLPSGTLWCDRNVGASKPSDYGLYFQWGDTQGYIKSQVGKDKHFSSNLSDYKLGMNSCFAKYVTKGTTLDLEDDAAHVNMGGDWHMPTPIQIKELVDNTINTWTTQDGVNGRLFTSKKDSSKSIFIPAAGFACDGEVLYSGDFGGVWSSMLGTGYVGYGQFFGLDSGFAYLGYGNRFNGHSVRGVIG